MDTGTGDDTDVVRVERTGIALVHQGEHIAPDPGSLARLRFAGSSTSSNGTDLGEGDPADHGRTDRSTPDEVHFWFPVEIEILGAGGSTTGDDASGDADTALARTVIARVFDELQQELASRG